MNQKMIALMALLMPIYIFGQQRPIAFKGAEGFGKYTTGGRGGKVMIVSNLNDSGPGSFREAAEGKGARMILFSVSGTIHLESPISIKPNVTIAGHSAPGDGICIADYTVGFGGDNIIVRYMRFRLGDKNQNKGKVDLSGNDDAFGGNGRKNIVIDHCSMSWSDDELFSCYRGDSTTLQWNLMAEPLNYSYHFETGDKDYENHGYGGIWGGKHLTAHHNMFVSCISRNPRFSGVRTGGPELVDYRNNVIYNWGHNNVYGGEGGNYNIVNNYYRPGPSTHTNVAARIVNPSSTDDISYGLFYVEGNEVEGAKEVTKNNWLGIHLDKKADPAEKKRIVMSKAFEVETIPVELATTSYEKVLAGVGASFRRDTLDQRVINDVKNKTGRIIDVQGGFPHGTPYEVSKVAWPALKSTPALLDTDKDGMPDEWEKKKGLNPNDANDSSGYTLDKMVTNIEIYLEEILSAK